MFSILVFLGVQKSKDEKKTTYNTEYLRKEIHVTLTTSTSRQILSINSHLWALSSAVLVFPPCFSAMQCVAPSGGSTAFYTTSVSHPRGFCIHVPCLEIFCSPPFLPSFLSDRRLLLIIWHTKRWDSIKEKKFFCLFTFKGGFAERPKRGTVQTTQSPRCSFSLPLYLLICSLSLLKTECKKTANTTNL